jgi:hypothetical protein
MSEINNLFMKNSHFIVSYDHFGWFQKIFLMSHALEGGGNFDNSQIR